MKPFTFLHKSFIAIIALSTAAMAQGASPYEVRFGDEANDTTAITEALVKRYSSTPRPAGELMVDLASSFIGTPYLEGSLEGSPERLTVNLQGFDCTTFVETVAAMVLTLEERRSSWIDFIYNLEKIRYRTGLLTDYASRLHYFSDWVVDNTHRGLIREVTDRVANPSYQVKTLDFMSSHKDKYAALEDSLTFERLKSLEIGFRNHRYPYVKPQNIAKADVHPGDIIAITTKISGLDVTHMGIAVEQKGKIHLLHASSAEGKVCVTPVPLADYVRRNHNSTGIRVVRLTP